MSRAPQRGPNSWTNTTTITRTIPVTQAIPAARAIPAAQGRPDVEIVAEVPSTHAPGHEPSLDSLRSLYNLVVDRGELYDVPRFEEERHRTWAAREEHNRILGGLDYRHPHYNASRPFSYGSWFPPSPPRHGLLRPPWRNFSRPFASQSWRAPSATASRPHRSDVNPERHNLICRDRALQAQAERERRLASTRDGHQRDREGARDGDRHSALIGKAVCNYLETVDKKK